MHEYEEEMEDSGHRDWAGGEGCRGHESRPLSGEVYSTPSQAGPSVGSSAAPGPPTEDEAMEGTEEQSGGEDEDECEGRGPCLRAHMVRDKHGRSRALRAPRCLQALSMAYHEQHHCVVCFKCAGGAVIAIAHPHQAAEAIWTHASNHLKAEGIKPDVLRRCTKPLLDRWALEHEAQLKQYYEVRGRVAAHAI